MIGTIRERTIVGRGGKIEVSSPELVEGSEVEVLILVDNGRNEMDTTEYLLSTEANREHLLSSIREAEKHPERLIPFDIDEFKKTLNQS